MPRPKSFLKKLSVDIARRGHKCQHMSTHEIKQGDKRLKLSVNRTDEHYCVECAVKMIDLDIAKLNSIRDDLLKQ